MKCLSSAMFLGSHSGQNEDGSVYYYGSFLDKVNNKTFNLYYNNMDYLKSLTPYKDYEIKFSLYKDKNNNWRLTTQDR